jgi:hypothetical protein
VSSRSQTRTDSEALEAALEVIELLADEVGPRRPTSRSERLAARLMQEHLSRAGLEARIEDFRGYSSFALPFAIIQGLAVAPALIAPRRRRLRSALALGAGALLASEGDLRRPLLSRALSRHGSANVVASAEPSGEVRRTLCLMCHLDSSRSGLIFDPRFVGALGTLIAAQSLAVLAAAIVEPLAGGKARGRRLLAAARTTSVAGLILLAERELRGEDVPGANDNASGCAVVATLASELAKAPLESTRVVVVMTGCEEAGTLGSQAFLRSHETDGWLFLNFDNVGGDGSVRFLRREGVLAKWDADPGLIAAAAAVAERSPELRMAPEDSPAGLTYDSSPVLAGGGRALTISVQDGYIPNLHWPTDTCENVDPDGVSRTLRAGRELLREIDAGAADKPTA